MIITTAGTATHGAPELLQRSMVYILTWMQEEAVLDECFIISINVFICSCVCNCVSINIRTYIHTLNLFPLFGGLEILPGNVPTLPLRQNGR